ncbi:MAG: hypothetical protein NUW00_00195 [Candidatus Kaiserbacteria bacterium]|nr:hypothetical protein [Candidatus Kaiserbacteria bacterium]
MQGGIATLVAIALVLWAVGAHMFTTVEAANLTYVKDTLSDSDTGSASNHTIQFLSPTGVTSGQTIVVSFPAGFAMNAFDFADVDLTEGVTDQDLVGAAPTASQWSAVVSGQDLTFTSGGASADIAANATVTIKVGTNATFGGVGNTQVTNPAGVQSYEFTITAGVADSGQTRVAIVDNVLVTANVDTTLTFTVSGVNPLQTVNGSPTTTAATSTSTSLPFGTLASNVSKTLAQDLTVATNAIHGYVVTVEQDANLLSSTGADIDGFTDGTYVDAPTAWVAPTNNIALENTWGHWGLTTTDGDLKGAGNDFSSANTWVAASTTPRAVMAHDGPSDGTTGTADSTGDDVGATRVGYQAQITALQEAGDDYSTTLTYIATPTF